MLLTLFVATTMFHTVTPPASSPALFVGHWEGAVGRLGSMQRIEIDFAVRDGRVAGSYRIAQLGLANEPLGTVTYTDSTVSFELLYGTFVMHIDSVDHELTGENKEWNPAVTLHLRQAPAEHPYDTAEVRVRNNGATIVGTLYLPRARGRVPLIVVAGGSTGTTRDHWEYRGWGDALARQNVAVFVYDRRGFGASSGDSVDVDLRAESADVVAMVHLLARRSGIDPSRIGVLGSSRGGWVAPLAAAASPEITMLLLECAPAVGVVEQELQRVRNTAPTDSVTAGDIAEAERYERLWLRAAFDSASWTTVDSASARARVARWRNIVLIPESPADLAWWRRNEIDQGKLLRSVRVPVLALFGSNDRTVLPSENLEPMRAAFAAGGIRDVTFRLVPGAGHGLWTNATLRGGGWDWPVGHWVWSAKAPGVFEEIGEWIGRR